MKRPEQEQGKRSSTFMKKSTTFIAGMAAGVSVAMIPVIVSRRDLDNTSAAQIEEGYTAGFRHGTQCGINEAQASSPDVTTAQLQNICWKQLMMTLEKGRKKGLSRNNPHNPYFR